MPGILGELARQVVGQSGNLWTLSHLRKQSKTWYPSEDDGIPGRAPAKLVFSIVLISLVVINAFTNAAQQMAPLQRIELDRFAGTLLETPL